VALHDLSLAALFCHNIVLLKTGRGLAAGAPAEVLTREHLVSAYGIRAEYRTIDGIATVLSRDGLP
jgi:iron complex transport system ATP-binding protein